jgi:hypothetical protein
MQPMDEGNRQRRLAPNETYSIVCSHHFKPQDYLNRPNTCKKYLWLHAVPSLSLSLNARTIPIASKSAKRKKSKYTCGDRNPYWNPARYNTR